MPVKVISGQKVRAVECSRCGAMLEFTYADTKSTDFNNGSINYRYIVCPCCQHQMSVK